MSEAEEAKQYQQQINAELFQLTNSLSMQLAIPLLEGPLDVNFATDCVNAIIGGLNPGWKKISFSLKSEADIDSAWQKLVQIVQSAFLTNGEKIIEEGEQLGIENILIFYEVLNQGCEVLRQQNLSHIMNKNSEENNCAQKKQQPKSKKEQKKVPKGTENKKVSQKQTKSKNFSAQKSKQNPKQKSREKSKQKVKNVQKQRPKTSKQSKIVKQQAKKLQQEIIQNVAKVMGKRYLTKQEPKRQAKIRQKQGTEAVQKAKRTLDYAVKDFQVSNRLNALKKQKSQKTQKKDLADYAYMKMIQNKHKKLNSEMQSQQLKYYLELRDKKVAYIRHIHKLIEKLEKQRERDFNKQLRQVQIAKKSQMIEKIQNVDNLFRTNMEKLQQNYDKRKKVEQLHNVGQLEVCRAMEKQMKIKKLKQIQDMKNLWQQERNQLHQITGNQQKMKNKLIQIYRKYRV